MRYASQRTDFPVMVVIGLLAGIFALPVRASGPTADAHTPAAAHVAAPSPSSTTLKPLMPPPHPHATGGPGTAPASVTAHPTASPPAQVTQVALSSSPPTAPALSGGQAYGAQLPARGQPAQDVEPKPAPAVRPVVRQELVVRSGDTVDKVLRRTLHGAPFRDEVMRRAFTLLNPDAFARGSSTRLTRGAVVQVPTVQDMLALLDIGQPAAHDPSTAAPAVSPAYDPEPDMARRRWVSLP